MFPHNFKMLTANNAASKPRKSNKPKYAKNARSGDTVHVQGNKVTNRPQLKRWFGSQADDHCFTGVLEEVTETLRFMMCSTQCLMVQQSLLATRTSLTSQGRG
jgi:hypothetical protein